MNLKEIADAVNQKSADELRQNIARNWDFIESRCLEEASKGGYKCSILLKAIFGKDVLSALTSGFCIWPNSIPLLTDLFKEAIKSRREEITGVEVGPTDLRLTWGGLGT